MKLPGISKIPNLISLKTKNGWKEIQKNSSVAAKKGQNFILDNMRPLGASKNAKARWSISAGQKPVNPAAAPRKKNIDFAKLVSNVWLYKSSSSMPLKDVNDKLKKSLNGAKITDSFFQKTSAVSPKYRDALQARANDLLKRLNNAEEAIDRSRFDIFKNGNGNKKESRVELDPRLREAFSEATSAIDSARKKIDKNLKNYENLYQKDGFLSKTGLSREHYNRSMKDLDDIEFYIQSKLKTTKKVFDDLSKS